MNKIICISLIVLVGSVLFFSFSLTRNLQDPWKAPAYADTIKSPFSFSPPVIREGENLYNIYCVSCHGKTGLGDGSPGKFKIEPANFHTKAVTDQKDGALFWKLSAGRGIMPGYGSAFSEEKRWQLISYIRQFPKLSGAIASAKPQALLPLIDYKIDVKMSGQYFPLPQRLSNLTSSESQLFMVDTVVKGLNRPWSMVFLPDKTVLIAERGGKLLLIKNGKLQNKPIGGNVPKGLRDLKLHPHFQKNKLIYLSYYLDPIGSEPGYTILMRGRLEGNHFVDEKILYKAGPFKGNGEWYGSKIAFDKKGYLFFTVGLKSDRKNAQDLSLSDGKTMRLNDDGTIPSDNPFVNNPNALPEIYSYGHRVHEGLLYDSKEDRLLSTEFGELGGDELNVIKPGLNYGWPVVSHSLEYNGSIISKSPFLEGMEPPVSHFSIAPSGLDFVYGNIYPKWKGNLFIGGLATKMLYRMVIDKNSVSHHENLLPNIGRVRDVKFAPDHFLYVITEDTGLLVRLIPVKKI
jgi:glucose/arabinose dehydrogenase